jgi:hypothetical protein
MFSFSGFGTLGAVHSNEDHATPASMPLWNPAAIGYLESNLVDGAVRVVLEQ